MNAVADAPVAADLAVSTAENTALAFTAADFKEVFSDADAGDSLKAVQVVTLPDPGHGALALDDRKAPEDEGKPGDGKDGRPGRDRPGARQVRAVTVDQVIAVGELGTLTFTPAPDWNGEASFTFRVVDRTDRESVAAAATITVVGVAGAPEAGALNVSTAEDTVLSFTADDFEGVFTDADAGDSLKAVKVVTLPDAAHGALALSGTAVSAGDVIAHRELGDAEPDLHAGSELERRCDVHVQGGRSVGRGVCRRGDGDDHGDRGGRRAGGGSAGAEHGGGHGAGVHGGELFEGVFSDADAGDSLKAVKVVTLPDAAHGVLALSGTSVTLNQVIARAELGNLTFTPAGGLRGRRRVHLPGGGPE